MHTCSAAGFSLIEASCICMCAERHVACSVYNAIIGVCGNIAQERFNKLFSVYHCLSLTCTDGIECSQKLVIDSSCVIKEPPNNLLNTLEVFGQQGADVSLSGVNWVFWPYEIDVAVNGNS